MFGTGRASEAHLNMDVNLRRLPERTKCKSKFPVPLAGFIEHPYPTDSADIQSKQRKDSLQTSKTCILELWYFKTKQHSFTLQKFPYHISFLKYRQNL